MVISGRPQDDDGFAALAQLESRRVALWAPKQSLGKDAQAEDEEAAYKTSSTRFFWPVEVGFDPGGGFAAHPSDAGGGGAIRQSSEDLPMLIEQGGGSPLLYRWIDLPQIPEMFLEHLWISEDQRFSA